jgi:hypothetical protein
MIEHRLPIRIPPKKGASLADHLETTAQELDLPVSQVLRWIGISRLPTNLLEITKPGVLKGELKTLSHALRLSESEVQSLTYASLERLVLPGKNPWKTPASTRRSHRKISEVLGLNHQISVCPQCVQEGYSRLIWQTRWVLACTKHKVMLVHTCPSCQLPIGAYRRLARVPNIRCCDNHQPNAARCEQSLSVIPVVCVNKAFLDAQNILEGVLKGRAPTVLGREKSPLDYLKTVGELLEILSIVNFNDLVNPSARMTWKFADARMVWIPNALELLRLPNDHSLEDAVFDHIETSNIEVVQAQKIKNAFNRLLQRQPKPYFDVVLREIIKRLEVNFQIWR